MKKIYTLILFCLVIKALKCQPITCNLQTIFCNGAGGPSLQNSFYHVTIPSSTDTINYAKYPLNSNFGDVVYRLNCCDNQSCPVNDCKHIKDNCYYEVFYPDNYDKYASCPLPAVIMFHSGGYSECATANQSDIQSMCSEIASRGFVVFDVNYRAGVLRDPRIVTNDPSWTFTSAQQMLAIYRGCQDARGAIRSIIKRQNNETTGDKWGDNYRIDPTKIFIGGMSAGSLISLSTVYYNQSTIDQVFPGFTTNVSDPTILGNIDIDYYYGESTINYISSVKGVLNMWGSMFIPLANIGNPYNYFVNKQIPIISFAGVLDDVFNIHQQNIYFSPTMLYLAPDGTYVNFSKETNCLISSPGYSVPRPIRDPTSGDYLANQYAIGSETIYHAFHDNSIFSELYLDCQMYHGLDKVDDTRCNVCGTPPLPSMLPSTCTPCGYQSNFGGNFGTQGATYDYIASRAATFFQAIIGGVATSLATPGHNSKFVEQLNLRYGCNTANNPSTLINSNCDNDPNQN